VGQRVDNALYQHVAKRQPLKEPGAVAVMGALRAHGLIPVAAQVRATQRQLKLTTLVDLVCVRVGDRSLWAVEVKSTTLPRASHLRSYKRQCTRTPYLKNLLLHSECATHLLQAVFGAMALDATYPELSGHGRVRGIVAVVTSGGGGGGRVVLYEVPERLYSWSLFRRRPAVPLKLKLKSKSATSALAARKRKRAAASGPAMSWPDDNPGVDTALREAGLKRKGPTRRGQTVYALYRPVGSSGRKQTGATVGVVMCVPTRLGTLGKRVQSRVARLLQAAARRETAKTPEARRGGVSRLWLAVDTLMLSSLGPGCV
jgi:hypothetical protein